MTENSVGNLVVVGRGLALTMATAILSATLRQHNIKIQAVALPPEKTGPRAYVSGPGFPALCDILGVTERDVMARCKGSFRLGAVYRNGSHTWFSPYGAYGLQESSGNFTSGLLRYLHEHPQESLDSFSLAAQAAQGDKFALPPRGKPDLAAALRHGVCLDSDRFSSYLAALSQYRHVEFLEAGAVACVNRAENGCIQSIDLDGARRVKSDFWIDCSGDAAVLTERQTKVPSDLVWNARLSIVDSVAQGLGKAASEFTKTDWGWLRAENLQGEQVYSAFYNSDVTSKEVVRAKLEEQCQRPEGEATEEPLPLGVNQRAWCGNCLSVGHASTNLGGLAFSELSLVEAATISFVDMFPSSASSPWTASHFNQQWNRYVRDALDFTAFHHIEPGGVVPNEASILMEKVELFRRTGSLVERESDAVLDQQWLGMLLGQGVRPQRASLAVSSIDNRQLEKSLVRIKATIEKLAGSMPTHGTFVRNFFRQTND